MTAYYVTTSGSDSNNGLTEGTAFATPGYAAGQARTSGDLIYIKSGTYTLSTSSSNVSGGVMSVARGVQVEGYQTTIGDRAARPVIAAGSVTSTGAIYTAENASFNISPGSNVIALEVDGNSNFTYGFSFFTQYSHGGVDLVARNCSTGFLGSSSKTGHIFNCSAISCSSRGFDGISTVACLADQCATGYISGEVHMRSIASNCTGSGFYNNGLPHNLIHCVAYGNANGFQCNYDIGNHSYCIASENSQYGWFFNSTSASPILNYCADYNNTSGRNRATEDSRDYQPINLTSDPFTSASTGDFRINNDAGGGAELRQIQLSGIAGVNSVFDIGAIDAVVTAGGGNVIVIED